MQQNTISHGTLSLQPALTRVTVALLLAVLLAGCAESSRTTTYDPRRSCEPFGGRYSEVEDTCRYGGGM